MQDDQRHRDGGGASLEAEGAFRAALLVHHHRRDPLVVVTLLRTLGVAFGMLLFLLGVGAVGLAAVEFEGWILWAGTLGGVVLIFLGPLVVLVQFALARLVETAWQGLERLTDLAHRLLLSRQAHSEALLLREIRDLLRAWERRWEDGTRCRKGEGDQRVSGGSAEERSDTDGLVPLEQTLVDVQETHPFLPVDDVAAGEGARLSQGGVETSQQLYQRILELARERRWQEALGAAEDLLRRFPDSAEAARLDSRLDALRSKAAMVERRRLLAEVRRASAERSWGRAYSFARRLLSRYPDSEEANEVLHNLPDLRRLARRT